jgi:predicted RNA-binding protein YlxR (DUF448 family)
MSRPGLRHQPERTCIGCRGKAPKAELVRVVRRPEGGASVDRTGRAVGRGAYVHPAVECLNRAARSGALGRALKAGLTGAEAASLMREVRTTIGEDA